MNLRKALHVAALTLVGTVAALGAWADCTSPAGTAGQMKYASNYGVMAFCNGSNWVSMAGGVSVTVGGVTGASTLHELTDVDDTGKASGNYLTYNGTDWVPNNPFGTLTNTKWCTSDGTDVICNTDAPVLTEVDPQVGTITSAGSWCTTDGSAINCATAAPVLTEADPKITTLTNTKWCTSDGTSVICNTDAPILTEADPQVGSLTASNFCQADGTGAAIVCTNDATAQRTALGLGSMAVQDAGAVAITGGTATLTGLTAANVTATTAVSTANICDENGTHCVDVSAGLGTGGGAADRISSTDNQSMVIANPGTGTVSFTLGGAAQSAYFYPGIGLVAQGISTTTNQASFTTVYASGNVGIGTTSPNANLDVSGTVRMAGTGDETCGPSNYNTLRVNPVTRALEMCRE